MRTGSIGDLCALSAAGRNLVTVGPLTLKQPAPRATMMYYQQQRLLSKALDLSHLIRSWLSSSPHLRLSRSHRVCVPDQHNRTPGDVRVRHNHHVVKHALGLVRDSSCARSLTHHRAGFVTEVLRVPGPSAADRGAQESSWCYNPRASERYLHYEPHVMVKHSIPPHGSSPTLPLTRGMSR